MNLHKHAEAVYRDFEKLYRLSGIYKGNARQIDKQLKYIDNNLRVHISEGFGLGASIRFDILMSSVFFQGEEVFREKTPEFTLSYALFYEGVKSLIFTEGIRSTELFDWITTVKSALESGTDDEDDLASMLWRKSSPHIKVSLYNIFGDQEEDLTDLKNLELETDDLEDFEEAFIKEVYEAEFMEHNKGAETSLQAIDFAWDLPSGDLAIQKLGTLGVYDAKSADRMKRELGDLAVSDRAKKIIRFVPEEIAQLKRELESYDENQVEFNTIVRYLGLLELPESQIKSVSKLISSSVSQITQSVVKRFHAGLLLFILKRIKTWKDNDRLIKRYEEVEPEIKSSLSTEKNLKILAKAFGISNRVSIAKELFHFCDPKYYQYCFNVLIDRGSTNGQKNFLSILLEWKVPLETLIIGWGNKEIEAAIPILSEEDWEHRHQFLVRCLRSRSPAITRLAIRYISKLRLDPKEAYRIYEHFNPSLRREYLSNLIQSSDLRLWKDFVSLSLQRDLWRSKDTDLMALWVSLSLKCLGIQAAECFENYVNARKFLLWPKFRTERETILSVAMSMNDARLGSKIKEWADKEKSLLFQSRELKHKLQMRA